MKATQFNVRNTLLVKKSNSEGSDFYYLGNLSLIENSAIEKKHSR